ncbi:hypothetical protein [Sandaracinus amylolyticus]|uniref:hypothetical protein n=1 Tax=Sandaracinus amylolyticus TaxID=927083 RepID=UPI00069D238A|nr:hypothetical protein [Sandaracinus amylolyticus]
MSFIWRKLLSNPPTAWKRLPLITRGVGDEILRALDDDGEIDCGSEDHTAVVCRLTAAHPKERRRICQAVAELVRERFLLVEKRDSRTILRGQLPDLALAARSASGGTRHSDAHDVPECVANDGGNVASGAPPPSVRRIDASAHQSRSAQESDAQQPAATAQRVYREQGASAQHHAARSHATRSSHGPSADAAHGAPGLRANSAHVQRTAPVEERRGEEKRSDPPNPPEGGWDDVRDEVSDRLEEGYAARYQTATGERWLAGLSNRRAIAAVAAWARAGGDPIGRADAALDGFFADDWATEHRWPWGRLAKDPARYADGARAAASERARIAELQATLKLIDDLEKARAAGDFDRYRELERERARILSGTGRGAPASRSTTTPRGASGEPQPLRDLVAAVGGSRR